jgi:integrase
VRRLAYEAADNGLPSPDLAGSIRRVKGAKKLGTRLGNWLTCAQGRRLLDAPNRDETKGKRDHAILAILLGCGLRRTNGLIFRCVTHSGTLWGSGISEKVVWWVVRHSAQKAAIEKVAPHDLPRTCARLCHSVGGELEQIQFLLGHRSVETTKRYLGSGSGLCTPSITSWASCQTLRRAEEVTANETLRAHPGRSEFEFGRAKQHARFSRP